MDNSNINIDDIDEKTINALLKIRKYEDNVEVTPWYLGWAWSDVKVPQATINKLISMELVDRTYESNKHKLHGLTEQGRQVLAEYDALSEQDSAYSDQGTDNEQQSQLQYDIGELEQLTENMFDDIIGYDNLKELVRESLLTDKPFHILLVGPPALAKTMILFDIEKCLKDYATWIVGSATSKAGLWDMIADQQPRILLIDEIDKMGTTDTAALLSLMEKGRLVRTKMGRKLDVTLNVWVVACANRIHKMPPELISRFKVYNIKEYNSIEFKQVVSKALVNNEDTPIHVADEIATKLVNKTHDVREAIRIARLSKRVGVDRAIELMLSGN